MNTLLWVLLFFIWNNNVLVHGKPPLEIENDDRKVFDVASFGYLKGGQLNLTLENYQLSNITSPGTTAFYIRKGHTFSSVFTEDSIRPVIDGPFCFLENSFVKDEIEDQLAIVKELPDDNSKPWETTITVGEGEEGIWEVLYVNCKDSLVSFKLTVTQVNPGNSHLSAGDSPLPFVYGLSAVAYIIVAIYWASLLTKGNDTKVFRAHWLMLVLVIIIVINKALQSAKYHYMKIGVLSEGWSIGFYIFASIRGLLSIIIIVLLASGWMFIKPFLSSKDKTIISIVVPLQILANVAKAIGNEAAMGSVDWPFWNSLFPLIDLVACGIILWTILQTRKTLSAGTSADGKENDILNKYRLWSSFYLVTLVYIYITRIIVQLLQAALPFQYITWLGEAVNETATLLFYIFIGWKFRPYANNPYMQIATDEIDDEEETDYTTINQGSVRLQSLSRRE